MNKIRLYMIILEPRKVDERLIKLQQKNKRLLMENEVLNIETYYFKIDESWNFDLNSKYIKTKKIFGNVLLKLHYIPSWLKDIEINGQFDCGDCNLTSLENSPKIINGTFQCDYNKLKTLDDGPTFVDGDYYCYSNDVKFTEEYVRSICNVNNFVFFE